MSKQTVIIDREFAALIIPPTQEEAFQLLQNLKADGCRDPLVVWGGHDILLDGHSRYNFCIGFKIPFTVKEVSLASRQDAIFWIVKNQLGRRNLTPWARAELALKLKPEIAAKAKDRQGKRFAPGEPIDTGKELGKIAGISSVTVRRADFLLKNAPAGTIAKLRQGQATINREYRDLTGTKDWHLEQQTALRTALEQIAHYEKPDGDSYAHALDVVQDIAARAIMPAPDSNIPSKSSEAACAT
jgi:hypothetical protein